MYDQKSDLGSIQAELQQLRKCNANLVNRISYEFENGKYGLRRVFNNGVFDALQYAFLKTDNNLSGKTPQSCRIHSFIDKAFNDLAWEKLESSEASPNNIDRNLLTDLLERIKDGYQKGLLKTSEYL